MKKIILIITLSLLSFSMLSATNVFDTVVAQVKLTKMELIKLSFVEEKLKLAEEQVGREFSIEEKDFILESIINNEIIKQAAKRDGVNISEDMVLQMLKQQVGANTTDQQVRDAVASQYKLPWDEVLTALIEQLTLQEYIKIAGADDLKKLNVPATEKDIVDFYNSNKTKFVNPDMVRVNHIFFSTKDKSEDDAKNAKKKAEESLLLIKKGTKSFDDMVQEVSDDRNSAKNGGELGFISRDEPTTIKILGSEFIETIFNLSMDSVHGVIQSVSGYHIVEITEKRSARILKLTDLINPASDVSVAEYINQNIQQQKVTQIFSQVTELVIERLRKEASVKIIDKSIPWK